MPGGVVAPLKLVKEWQTDAFPHGIRAGPALTAISVVFTALALVIVLARLYDRGMVRRNLGLDDALIVAASLPAIGLCICTCLAEQLYGFDRHVWDLTTEMAAPSRKITLSISVLYLVSTGLTKISILCFYRRIGEIRPWFMWTLWINMAFIIGYTLAFTLALPLECTPVDAYWNKANPLWVMTHKFHCINEGAKMVTAGALSALQDVISCVLPMALFWDLRISKRAKFALGFVFSLGLMTCIAGVVRTVKIYHIFFQTYDVTWAARPVFALTIMEACLGLICASMPALKNNVQRIFHIVIDPFTYGSSKSNRRWKNPFFRSYQKSFQDYFSRSEANSRRSEPALNGRAAPNNTYVDSCHTHSQKPSESKSVHEVELGPSTQRVQQQEV